MELHGTKYVLAHLLLYHFLVILPQSYHPFYKFHFITSWRISFVSFVQMEMHTCLFFFHT
jgi:hypothetical protein